MPKLLTISIAAYNVEKYIEKTLQSCILPIEFQKYLEVIIVNDGSSDKTLKIAEKYLTEYPDLFLCINKENGGYGSTINAAMEMATGKYFRLLDGDDWFDTKELLEFVKRLDTTDVDLILNDFSICHDDKNYIEKKILNIGDESVKDISELYFGDSLAMYSFCYKTELLQTNKIFIDENCFYTDVEFLLLPLKYAENYRYLHNNLYQYRVGVAGQSVSVTGMKRHYRDAQKVTNVVLNELSIEYSYKNIKAIVDTVACMMVTMTIKSMMCIEISANNRKEIFLYDKKIKEEFPEIYDLTNNSKIFYLLRKTKFWLYPVWTILKKCGYL